MGAHPGTVCKPRARGNSGTFHPVPPSRLSMWACLMGQAFKLTPHARLMWQSKEGVSVDMFKRHASKLDERTGVVPHVKQVWDSIVAESASEGKTGAAR